MPANWAPQNSAACQEPRGEPAEDCQGSASGLRHGTIRHSHTWASRTLPLPPAPHHGPHSARRGLSPTLPDAGLGHSGMRWTSLLKENLKARLNKTKPTRRYFIHPATSPLLKREALSPLSVACQQPCAPTWRERRLQIKVTLEVTEPTAEPTATLPSWLDWDLQQKQRAENCWEKQRCTQAHAGY